MSIFERYAPFVQEYIYRHNWANLRAIQVAAAEGIFSTDENLLLTASTASGKTEAAFFPIITLFSETPPSSVGCIYIGPLKALINDQFLRLTDLCREAHIPVWHWHGDVGQTHKEHLLKRPSGILQITPESLEAMLLRRHMFIPKLFHDLRFIVIDEVHSLMRGDRGGQTICLIERLCRIARVNPRRIGLSATIGDPQRTGEFLSLGTGRRTLIPRIDAKGSRWRLSMENHMITARPQSVEEGDETSGDTGTGGAAAGATDGKPESIPVDPGILSIFELSRHRKCLVFVNSREECEAVTTTLRSYCERFHEADRFLIHHGNLSTVYRELAENSMRDETKQLTTVTTSTLELGIDIGRLERAFQIDAPWTVSSFLQRIGRTGRRDTDPEMCFVIRESPHDARDPWPATLPWKLLQGIAIVQLYLDERWVEPPLLDRLPYSLLYHQTMSVLTAEGEQSPKALASKVLSLRIFHRISQDDYRLLLRHLIQTKHIEQTEQGGLLVGLEGEKIINSYKFYGVFKETEEYSVRDAEQTLGTIAYPPPVGDLIAIAGHVWRVLDVDYRRHVVTCEKVKGKTAAYFGQCPGDLHTRILTRMQKVLQEDRSYPYLLPKATERLEDLRMTARNTRLAQKILLNPGGDIWYLFPWLGTYAFMALERFLRIHCAARMGLRNFDAARPYFMQFTLSVDEATFFGILFEEAEKDLDPMTFLFEKEVPLFNKYDEHLPRELVRKGFACGVLGVDEMKERILEWKDQLSPAENDRASRDTPVHAEDLSG